jgi:hypothetical protein
MVNQSWRVSASVDSHVQRIQHKLPFEIVRHRPSDDLPRVGVQDEREVEPSLLRSHIRNVRNPRAIRSRRAKLRFTRSGAGGVRSVCEQSVVQTFLLRPPHPNSPASRISLATRFLAHLTPNILSSKCILGAQ